jgi:hypothetical protein
VLNLSDKWKSWVRYRLFLIRLVDPEFITHTHTERERERERGYTPFSQPGTNSGTTRERGCRSGLVGWRRRGRMGRGRVFGPRSKYPTLFSWQEAWKGSQGFWPNGFGSKPLSLKSRRLLFRAFLLLFLFVFSSDNLLCAWINLVISFRLKCMTDFLFN